VVVVVVVVEDNLGERTHEKIFSLKKKNLLLDNNKGWISVSLLGKCKFPFVSDLPRSHRVHNKEHTQTRKPFLLCF
jgi:hypothetical protein